MYLILVALALLMMYAGLLVVEAYRGARFFSGVRGRFDAIVERWLFIVRHVDFGSFARTETKRAVLYVTHHVAHAALGAVRTIEHLLAHVVRRLKLHPEAPAPSGESARHFVRTLSEFKGHLKTTRPEMPEVR